LALLFFKYSFDVEYPDLENKDFAPFNLEETDEGESWSIHSLWILAIRSDDVAAF
jgi:hypothetical protein